MNRYIKQHHRFLLLWGIIILLFAVPLFLFLQMAKSKPMPGTIKHFVPSSPFAAQVTSVPAAFIHKKVYDRNIYPGTVPTTVQLTLQERTFLQARSQSFPLLSSEKGELVITSEVSGVTVHVKPMEDAQYSDTIVNTTPFRFAAIPAGYYLVSAVNPSYGAGGFLVVVEPNKITRLRIHLNPNGAPAED